MTTLYDFMAHGINPKEVTIVSNISSEFSSLVITCAAGSSSSWAAHSSSSSDDDDDGGAAAVAAAAAVERLADATAAASRADGPSATLGTSAITRISEAIEWSHASSAAAALNGGYLVTLRNLNAVVALTGAANVTTDVYDDGDADDGADNTFGGLSLSSQRRLRPSSRLSWRNRPTHQTFLTRRLDRYVRRGRRRPLDRLGALADRRERLCFRGLGGAFDALYRGVLGRRRWLRAPRRGFVRPPDLEV